MFKCSRCERIFAPPRDLASPVRGAARERGSGESLPLPFSGAGEELLEEATGEEPYHTEAAGETEPGEAEPDGPPRRISVRPLVLFACLVVAGYALLARAMLADPQWAAAWVERIPLLGRTPFSSTLAEQVDLSLAAVRWQRLRDGATVLVVTGTARNDSPFPLASIQIEVAAVGSGATAVDHRIVFCGHPVPERLQAFSLQQLLILVSIKPPRHYAVDPGDACPFTAILTRARAAPVTAIEARVVAALPGRERP